MVTTQFLIRNIINFKCNSFDGNSARNSGLGHQIEDQITPGYLCTVQLVVITNSVFMNYVLPTSWYSGEAVRLCTVSYSVQIYDAQTK